MLLVRPDRSPHSTSEVCLVLTRGASPHFLHLPGHTLYLPALCQVGTMIPPFPMVRQKLREVK